VLEVGAAAFDPRHLVVDVAPFEVAITSRPATGRIHDRQGPTLRRRHRPGASTDIEHLGGSFGDDP